MFLLAAVATDCRSAYRHVCTHAPCIRLHQSFHVFVRPEGSRTLKCVIIHFMRSRLFLEETFFYTEYLTTFSGGGCWQTECRGVGGGRGELPLGGAGFFRRKTKSIFHCSGLVVPFHQPSGTVRAPTVRLQSEYIQSSIRSHSEHIQIMQFTALSVYHTLKEF